MTKTVSYSVYFFVYKFHYKPNMHTMLTHKIEHGFTSLTL